MPTSGFIGRIGGRLDQLDRERLQGYVQRLTREVAFLETVFDTLQEGVIVVDPRMRIRYVNHAANHILGLPADAAGRPVSRFLKGIDWGMGKGEDGGDRRVIRQEIEILYPQARALTVYVMPQPGERHSSIVVLHDVTESRHRTQAQVESEKVQMMSLLAAGVAHEIGNPLNSLHIHLQLLQRRLADLPGDVGGELREMLDVARDEVDRLHQVLSQFLAAIRSARPSLTPIHLPPLVEDTVHSLDREMRDRNIDLRMVWPEEMPPVFGDAGQLRQAFYNILRNAIQAMPGGGTLAVAAQADDDYVTVSLADSGQGISPEAIGRIFEPYYTTKQTGSGLGLMIVERIVRENGGQLMVDSEVGHGATFRVRLPRTSRRIKLLPAPQDAVEAEVGPGAGAEEPTPADGTATPSPARQPRRGRRPTRKTSDPRRDG
jgi:signal transduction histidine kinase